MTKAQLRGFITDLKVDQQTFRFQLDIGGELFKVIGPNHLLDQYDSLEELDLVRVTGSLSFQTEKEIQTVFLNASELEVFDGSGHPDNYTLISGTFQGNAKHDVSTNTTELLLHVSFENGKRTCIPVKAKGNLTNLSEGQQLESHGILKQTPLSILPESHFHLQDMNKMDWMIQFQGVGDRMQREVAGYRAALLYNQLNAQPQKPTKKAYGQRAKTKTK